MAKFKVRQVNVLGCRNALEAAVRRGVKKFVYTSSITAFQDFSQLTPHTEEDREKHPPIQHWCYSTTKREADDMVRAANGVCGLKTVCLRPTIIYGPGEKSFTPKILQGYPLVKIDLPYSPCYSGNLAVWHSLADRSLDINPEVTAGKGYFVADDNEMRRFNDYANFHFMSLKKEPKFISLRLLYLATRIPTLLDWYTAGKFLEFSNVPNDLAYQAFCGGAPFNVERGIKELGYQRKYSPEQITATLRKYYGIKE